ncbi:MAG: UDP-glucose dehydrogenase family protein [Acidimicrobiia bacterium]
MDVAVIGAGYVGLVTGAGLAGLGHRVRVSEADPARLETLRTGKAPFHEPGLEDLVRAKLDAGMLSFHGDNREAVSGAEIVFIAVPTPMGDEGAADLSIVDSVLREAGSHLDPNSVVVLKSTVPPGSARTFHKLLRDLGVQAHVVSNPEFLRQGKALEHFLRPDRIVVGADDPAAVAVMQRLYAGVDCPLLVMDPTSAELVKYGSNSFLAARVSFVNSMANLAEVLGADIDSIVAGMGLDRRIGNAFFKPGPGYGGSCLPKDTRALLYASSEAGYDFDLLDAVIRTNERQLDRMVAKVEAAAGDLRELTVAVWGLTFKAGTSDVRHSPAAAMADKLRRSGAVVRAYDPMADRDLPGVDRVGDAVTATRGAAALIVATEWEEFAEVDLSLVRDAMEGRVIIDTRNMLDAARARELGFAYEGVGRGGD